MDVGGTWLVEGFVGMGDRLFVCSGGVETGEEEKKRWLLEKYTGVGRIGFGDRDREGRHRLTLKLGPDTRSKENTNGGVSHVIHGKGGNCTFETSTHIRPTWPVRLEAYEQRDAA